MTTGRLPRDVNIPGEITDLIRADLATRNLELVELGPSEPFAAAAGSYEQEYVATIAFPDGTDGMAIYSAYQNAGEWTVDHRFTEPT